MNLRFSGTAKASTPAPTAAANRDRAALELLKQRRLSEASLSAAGFASVDDLLEVVARRFNVARLELDGVEIAVELATLLPRHLAERHRLVPTYLDGSEVSIATADPTQLEVFDWIGAELKRSVSILLASPLEIDRAIRRLYDEPATKIVAVEEEVDVTQEALLEATQIVDRLIAGAVEAGASDIHIEASEKETVTRYRVDGGLRHVDTRPAELHPAIVSRIKVLAELDISVRYVPQDGRIKMRRAEGEIDLRVSVLPTYWGEKVCMRILDSKKALLPLEDLGFDKKQLEIFQTMVTAPYGLLLVTGPTGSGKSTTLYGALNTVRAPDINIVSVEDPIEYQLPGINQVQVNVKRGLSFAGALRSILRQDPDVILIGEIRDHETGVIASEAALTGHLVLASLHTNDAPGAITRLTEMGVQPYLVAPSMVGVIAQRLLRKVCTGCVEEYEPSLQEREALGLQNLPPEIRFKRGRGCFRCNDTGYSGRTAVRELLEVTEPLRALISRGATTEAIREHALSEGFKPMRFQALKKLIAGITSAREVMRVTRG